MEKFIYLFIHLVLPILVVFIPLKPKYKTKFGLFITLALKLSVLLFLYIWGQWPLVGSNFFKYFMIVGMLIVIYQSFKAYKTFDSTKKIKWFAIIRNVLTTLFTLLILYALTTALISRNAYDFTPVELDFPLKNGIYYISSGSASSLLNNHMRTSPSTQHYAVDIHKLNSFQSASKGFLATKNADHYIFNDTVYCPCDAEVLDVKNTVKDNLTSSMQVSQEDGTGNFVSLKCNDIYVFIPHFKQESIVVKKGQQISKGIPLGLVGNSGFSQEPHLHFQAAKYTADSVLLGVPIKIKGNILDRNDIYKTKID